MLKVDRIEALLHVDENRDDIIDLQMKIPNSSNLHRFTIDPFGIYILSLEQINVLVKINPIAVI